MGMGMCIKTLTEKLKKTTIVFIASTIYVAGRKPKV